MPAAGSVLASNPERHWAKRTWLQIILARSSAAAATLLPALPQPLIYHDVADQRSMLGVENFQDVASNIGFLAVGFAGLAIVARPRTRFEFAVERWPYAVFFVGMLLTAGSGNVVPYLVLQIYAVAALLLIAMTQPSRYTRNRDIYWVFGACTASSTRTESCSRSDIWSASTA